MPSAAQVMGARAEELAARHLRRLGWLVVGRNVRVGRAEIDILAIDPASPPTLVAVEVRWRATRSFGLPEETVGHAKLARLRAAAQAMPEATPAAGPRGRRLPVRVDIVAVEPPGRIRHHRHAG
jgi:putative endonuclease